MGGDKNVKKARPGDRAPYIHFDGGEHAGESIFSRLRGVDHHLLLFPDQGASEETARAQTLSLLSSYSVKTQVHVIDAAQHALRRAYGVTSPTAFLIRPDGHIAWRGAANLNVLAAYMDTFYTQLHATEEREASRRPTLQGVV